MNTARKKERPDRDGADVPGEMFRRFGLCLRIFREISGHSGTSIARSAGIGKSRLSKYELGRELPKLSSFEKILTALELSPLTFFYALAALERGFTKRGGGEVEIVLQEGSTGSLLSAQEQEALRGLFHQFVHVLETTIEGRFLARSLSVEEPGP
jgi:transcriptional regulator with XRE-family HTH domain